jgi:hypothetical protein
VGRFQILEVPNTRRRATLNPPPLDLSDKLCIHLDLFLLKMDEDFHSLVKLIP